MKTIILYALYYLCDGNYFCEQHMSKCVDYHPWEMMSHNEKMYVFKKCQESFYGSDK